MRHLIIYTLCAAALFTAIEAAGQGGETGQGNRRTMSASELRRQERLFDEHIVRMGETAYSIARGYGISPVTLAEDNPGVDLTRVKTGQVLLIRKREQNRTDPADVAREWQAMTTAQAARDAALKAETEAAAEAAARARQQAWQSGQSDSTWMELSDGDGRWLNRRGGRGLPDFSRGDQIPDIALMLPLDQGAGGSQFTDFYKGALLALEELKAQGHSARVTLHNSGNSAEKVREIVTSREFAGTDLVIGPVYEAELEPAVRFGETMGIPVVSPLATRHEIDSDALWQMAPDSGSEYDKLRPLLAGDTNVIVVSSGAGGDDPEFARKIAAELNSLGRPYQRFTIDGGGDIFGSLDRERPNVLVVLAGSEHSVNSALATISTAKASNPRVRLGPITVIGTSKWAAYGNSAVSLKTDLLFKLAAQFVTNYHIDRSDRETRLFEARYLEAYGDLPSKPAFRGYDAVALFAGALFESGETFEDRIAGVNPSPLGTTYRFVRRGDTRSGDTGPGLFGGFGVFGGSDGRRHVNDQWTLVTFSNDYNISTQ